MDTLRGRVAVVTGAASGIGLAIATRLGAEGMRVAMTDLDGDAVAEASQHVEGEVEAFGLDVRDAEAVEDAAARVVDRFGSLHVAVNNAGIVNRGYAWELPPDEWHRVLDVNLFGVIHGVRAFVPRILATGEPGHVVNVASMAAVLPQERLGPYTVAKHGVLGLSDVLRADLGSVEAPVGVSVVMPGRIRTGMNPIGKHEPSVVAANVLDAVLHDRPYVFTDRDAVRAVDERLRSIIDARGQVVEAGEGAAAGGAAS